MCVTYVCTCIYMYTMIVNRDRPDARCLTCSSLQQKQLLCAYQIDRLQHTDVFETVHICMSYALFFTSVVHAPESKLPARVQGSVLHERTQVLPQQHLHDHQHQHRRQEKPHWRDVRRQQLPDSQPVTNVQPQQSRAGNALAHGLRSGGHVHVTSRATYT